jgi:flavin reductase (DIM6/NTAB) family NADH-FMN oxidoreductase RutF
MNVSERFAAPAPDKFENVAYRPGISGIPCLEGSLSNIECRISEIYDAGDHSVIIGNVESVSVAEGEPLLYFRGRYGSLAPDAVSADIN